MRRTLRGIAAILGMTFEADARLALVVVVSDFLRFASLFGVAISLKVVVDAALNRDVTQGIIGGAVSAVALGAGIYLLAMAGSLTLALQQKIGGVVDRRLMTLTASIPTLELHDRSEYLSKLQLLLDERFAMNVALQLIVDAFVFGGMLIAAGVILGLQHPLLGLLPFSAVPLIWLGTIGNRYFRRAEESTGEERRLGDALFNLSVNPDAGKELRIFGLREELTVRQGRAEEAVIAALNRASWIGNALRGLGWTLFTVAYAVAVLVVVNRAAAGRASAGDVILTIAIAAPITFLVGVSGTILDLLQSVWRSAERYQWLRDVVEQASRPPRDPAPIPASLRSGIRLDHVSFQYPGSDRVVLSDVNLEWPAGSVVALVGENGAGKTTLVKLLSRLYDPSEGTILVDGVDLTRLPSADWRARICAGFQDFCQFEVLARETVGLGDLPRISNVAAVETGLERAAATDVLIAMPQGLETQLGKEWEGGVELSTGQWQKLALSRALMRDEPLLIILDEPTAALDAATEHALFERFSETARAGDRASDRITVLVSHRFSTVRMADLIVVLDQGRVAEAGSHTELVARGGLYAELYELQAKSYR